ncbi:probable inactive receptor kinase At3g08680 [Hibiscus syriacus]|uniref:probable inactive receptor kinase At3g08680 n=1 Tax=Hibiscus syriacus TaxID=106335 RepID=UPI0019220B5F|nr:probable inactive receptor kinase At3g08680 [Hibiscus syriacus]
MEPLISEYGIPSLLDHKRNCFFANGYAAPEKSLSEKGDVFSFGVILLELLTGKMVEKTEVDLPKWVKSMVREEWTGEVFDKEVPKTALKWAFPLLNTALKCVSHSPQDRPTAFEVSEKIDEALLAHDDRSVSSMSSWEYGHPDMLYTSHCYTRNLRHSRIKLLEHSSLILQEETSMLSSISHLPLIMMQIFVYGM